jgi:hypothetical protein
MKSAVYVKGQKRKGGSQVRGSEAASRVGEPVYHAGQGQDERAHSQASPLLRGLDSTWSVVSNPHRESGTRCRAAADVGAARGAAHGRPRGHGGNRLGDSVGAEASGTAKGPGSAAPAQEGKMVKSGLDSGRGLAERMRLPGLLKERGLIRLLGLPDSVENACPDIGQGSDGDGMALALGPLALVILLGPRFLERALPGKLVQGIAPGLDTAQPTMGLLVRPALEEDGRCTSQGLQTAGVHVSAAIITHFGQQARSKTRSSSWQRGEELAVGMDQKKALNLLVVLGNLLEQGLQLVYQGQHQPRFGPRDDLGSLQAGLLEVLDDLLCFLAGTRISGLLEHSSHLRRLGGASGLQRRIGAQEHERRGLLQLAEDFQCDRVIGFEASGELVDQASLHLDQGILVAREGLELLDLLAVGVEPVQILEVSTPGFGQQIGVNRVRLGSRGGSSLLNGPRIDRVHGPSLFQQMRNQEPMRRFYNAGDSLAASRTSHPFQVRVQLAQSFGGMSHPDRAQLMPLFVDAEAHHDDHWPNRSHKSALFRSFPETTAVSELLCPYTVALEARLSDDQSCSETTPRKDELS